MFDKKFKEYLERSPEHKALKERCSALESQIASMSRALSDVVRAYSDLARISIDNRKSLEEVFAYLTDPLGDPHEDPAAEPVSEMTPEELAAYKRNLN